MGQGDPAATVPQDEGIRLVLTGKGGVGKTTLTAALARLLAREGRRVLAVEADAQLNLAAALGLPRDEALREDYKRMIAIRRAHPALSRGPHTSLSSEGVLIH